MSSPELLVRDTWQHRGGATQTGVPEQLPRPGEDHRLAAAVQAVQVTCIRHAIQDGSSGSGHAPTPSLFNILCKELHTVTAGHGHTCRRSGSRTPRHRGPLAVVHEVRVAAAMARPALARRITHAGPKVSGRRVTYYPRTC